VHERVVLDEMSKSIDFDESPAVSEAEPDVIPA